MRQSLTPRPPLPPPSQVASASHKPGGQAVVPRRAAAALLATIPLSKLPGFGGKLGDALAEANPDLVIIVGDDQAELFSQANQPAFAIFNGEAMVTHVGKYAEGAPDWLRQVGRGYLMESNYTLPASPVFATQLIEGLVDLDVDVASVAGIDDPEKAGFGHAYGFIVKRLFRRSIPVVPVLLNMWPLATSLAAATPLNVRALVPADASVATAVGSTAWQCFFDNGSGGKLVSAPAVVVAGSHPVRSASVVWSCSVVSTRSSSAR